MSRERGDRLPSVLSQRNVAEQLLRIGDELAAWKAVV